MRIKKHFSLLALLVVATSTQVFAESLSLTSLQIENLGIQLAKPVVVKKSPLFVVPATVSIPPSFDFIVSTPHEGLIDKVEISVGDSVKKGQLLARVFSPGYLELQKDYLSALSDQKIAAIHLNHDAMLFKEGVVSDHTLMETRARYKKFDTLFKEHKQLLKMGGMSAVEIKKLTNTGILKNYLKLRAPVDGVVLKRTAIAGQRVEKLAPVFRVASIKKLYVELAVPQEKLAEISLNDEVEIEKKRVTGKIILIGQSVDLESQSVLVRAVVDGKSGMLRPGEKISVQLFKRSDHNLYRIPTSSIFRSGHTNYMFVRILSGFDVRQVKIVGRNVSGIVIEGHLNADEKVVSVGVATLKSIWLEQSKGE